ncbi:hypothetical protein BDP81DRAFT_75811 [Colletotrichum phormii]|uniref:Secreted protein n=1 Tax=Colletotrichum phormii TaxID=359342 RepID=A0AAJ0EBJ1_9PEZI|nr:uncharacterized protein BDP81DRAFT_75811 [Colletotrichum phormii]KAK1625666.1 hypothetical protein BDP81DRAFT_75811 [Colletotrichum phormii]
MVQFVLCVMDYCFWLISVNAVCVQCPSHPGKGLGHVVSMPHRTWCSSPNPLQRKISRPLLNKDNFSIEMALSAILPRESTPLPLRGCHRQSSCNHSRYRCLR